MYERFWMGWELDWVISKASLNVFYIDNDIVFFERSALKHLTIEEPHERFDERRVNMLKLQLLQLERQVNHKSNITTIYHLFYFDIINFYLFYVLFFQVLLLEEKYKALNLKIISSIEFTASILLLQSVPLGSMLRCYFFSIFY